MIDVFFNSLYFILIMVIAVFFKKIDLLKKEDSDLLAKIIVNLTLPCVFFSGCKGISLTSSMMIYLILGFAVNFFMILLAYLLFHKQNHVIMKIIGCAGYDAGNFVVPYVQLFFPSSMIQIITIFNIGNTIMANGGTYSIASLSKGIDVKAFFKNLFSSVCFDTYIIILLIAIFKINVPDALITITSKIGSSSTLLVMLMIGLKLDFHMDKESFKDLIQIISTRLIGGAILCGLTYLLPISSMSKIVLCMIYFGPTVSVSSIYAKKAGYDGDVIANCNTITILLSILMSTVILSLYL